MLHKIYGKNTNNPEIAQILNELGRTYKIKKELDIAMKYSFQALNMLYIIYGKKTNHPEIANVFDTLGAIYNEFNQLDRALKYYNSELNMLQIIYKKNTNHSNIACVFNSIGAIYQGKNLLREAQQAYETSLSMNYIIHGELARNSTIAMTLYNLGNIYQLQYATLSEPSLLLKAEKVYEQSLDIYRNIIGENINHIDILDVLANLGFIYYKKNNFSQAIQTVNLALHMNNEMNNILNDQTFYNLQIVLSMSEKKHAYTLRKITSIKIFSCINLVISLILRKIYALLKRN